ncbi:hypothetical protein Droror1_Dr00017944 [Drosera rotundifolia]
MDVKPGLVRWDLQHNELGELKSFPQYFGFDLSCCIVEYKEKRLVVELLPVLVVMFSCVLMIEYFAAWKSPLPVKQQSILEGTLHCHNCWRSTNVNPQYCEGYWLGLIVDDRGMLLSYFAVFILA